MKEIIGIIAVCIAVMLTVGGIIWGISLLAKSGETNEEKNARIVSQTKFCNDNGLTASIMANGFTLEPEYVVCTPRK